MSVQSNKVCISTPHFCRWRTSSLAVILTTFTSFGGPQLRQKFESTISAPSKATRQRLLLVNKSNILFWKLASAKRTSALEASWLFPSLPV